MKTYQHGGRRTNMSRVSKRVTSVMISAAAAAITLFSVETHKSKRKADCNEPGTVPDQQRTGLVPDATSFHPWPRSERRSTFHSFRRPTRSRIQLWQGLSSS